MGLQNDFMVFFSKELSPVKTPENINYVRLNLTSINVTWTPLSLFEAQGFPIYKITLTPTTATNGRNKRQSSSSVLITQNNFAVFTNLNSNQEYSLVVSVATEGSSNYTSSQPTQGTNSSVNSVNWHSQGQSWMGTYLFNLFSLCLVCPVIDMEKEWYTLLKGLIFY